MTTETVPLLDEYTRAMTAEDANDLHGAVRIVRAREALADRLRELEAAAAERDEWAQRCAADGAALAEENAALRAELDAIKAGGGEPVATIAVYDDHKSQFDKNARLWVEDGWPSLPVGEHKLYATPPPSGDAGREAVMRWLEREAWGFLRNVLNQGMSIQMDYHAGKYESYEHLSARLDAAARERRDQMEAAIRALAGGGSS